MSGSGENNAGLPLADFKSMRTQIREMKEKFNESLRKLLEDFTDENIRRVHATDELRKAIQEDLKGQVENLRTLVERKSETTIKRTQSTPSSATITASVTSDLAEENRKWQEHVRTALADIADRLNRMQQRMEEIFQV